MVSEMSQVEPDGFSTLHLLVPFLSMLRKATPIATSQLDHGQLDHGQLDHGDLDHSHLDHSHLDPMAIRPCDAQPVRCAAQQGCAAQQECRVQQECRRPEYPLRWSTDWFESTRLTALPLGIVIWIMGILLCTACDQASETFGNGASKAGNGSKSTATVSAEDAPKGSNIPAGELDRNRLPTQQLPTLETTGGGLPEDDPAKQGWEIETFSSAVAKQLKHLGEVIYPDSEKAAQAELPKWVDAGYHSEPLRPQHLETVFADDWLTVRRNRSRSDAGPSTAPSPAYQGIDGFVSACRKWVTDIARPTSLRTKVKVFGVELDENEAGVGRTDIYVQVAAGNDRGSAQANATWHCLWTFEEITAPRLVSVQVSDYEEVVNQSGQQTLFSDCTTSVLDGDVFRRQLRPGIDHWLTRIESSMGIDIGGWQGLAVGDVNGDGLDDVYACQPGGLPNRLYVQQPDGTAREVSASSGVDWLESSHAALLADWDNDRDQDLLVGVPDGVLIMSNDGRGRFTVRGAQLLPSALPYSLAASDYDQDGDLDLFVCCYNRRRGVNRHLLFARPVPYHDANNGGRNVLLETVATPAAGKWLFRYATNAVGLDENNRRFSYAAAWEDYDNDGDQDLYVANDFGRNNLYRNDGGRFRDVAAELGVEDIGPGMSACWGDYDNDGRMDLYVSNMFSSAGNRITGQSQFHAGADRRTRNAFRRHARGNTLFRNEPSGTFRDVSLAAGVVLGRWAWGSKFADINNDGWQDLVVANGFITQQDTDDL